MKLERLSVRDQPVQDFLWKYLEPADFRYDYTKLDAMREVERLEFEGSSQLWGDLSVNFMFRVTVRNPKVMEPHVMGNALYLRSALGQGRMIAQRMGFERFVVWTQHEPLMRICRAVGFTHVGCVPRFHMGKSGELLDLHALSMEV